MTPFGDALHDRKTEAGPIAPRPTSSEERFEESVDLCVQNSRSGIDDLKQDSFIVTKQAHVHSTACRSVAKSVVDQVSNEHRQGYVIAPHRNVFDPCESQVDRTFLSDREQIGDHLLDDAVELAVGHFSVRVGVVSGEREKLFVAEADADGRTSQPAIFVAGELKGPIGAAAAAETGRRAAQAMLGADR